ncbi:class I mannose-6-phosphate isomerase [Prevotella sp. KH2C16]|uniref:class I mannose-6-phosphate isomerase n=1 Tax=Prevotella sp. KH2C16 TaxID=1855325 RepID=UPI000B827AA0|nr:class I mannose-6-phosphate isomerase [Prevotella sp. KH2C16]
MRKPNYDKYPATHVSGTIYQGWENIIAELESRYGNRQQWAIDLYVGAMEEEFISAFGRTGRRIVSTRSLMKTQPEIEKLTERFMTDDVLFGFISNVSLDEYFCQDKVSEFLAESKNEPIIIIGTGAAKFAAEDAPVVYADMARWEIQQRFRRHEVKALGYDNREEPPSFQYKRGYFNDWNICDRHKLELATAHRIGYWIDSNQAGKPKMISNQTFIEGIRKTARNPFRVVPFFDPAPWGGQWMKEVCDLDRSEVNYGWCFDCVPEENSLLLDVEGTRFEIPAQDLVLLEAIPLLGEAVESRFGKSFPIRFDFLDTMGGGNLSLQVHPTTQFVQTNFGIHYTQDESYYLLDAGEDAVVYLGLKEGVDSTGMINGLRHAQETGEAFPVEKYVNKIPAKKHDHFLIPNGTIHCSGRNSMVLEISATPNIFTFKLYDWQRLGLDGKPRPINIERGRQVIKWERDTRYVREHLANHIETLAETPHCKKERTGLHPNEFIETTRYTFDEKITLHNAGSVHVLNLAEGEEAVVESPNGAFDPFVVHYVETFIVPACVGEYTIRPCGKAEGKTCKVIEAHVRV